MVQQFLKKIDSLAKIWIAYLGILLITVVLVLIALKNTLRSLVNGSASDISSILSSLESCNGCGFIAASVIILQAILAILWITSLIKCATTLSFAKQILQFQGTDSEIFKNINQIKNYLTWILLNTILWIAGWIMFTVVFLFIVLDVTFKTLTWKKAKKIKRMINYIS